MAKKDTDNFDFEVEGEGKEKGKINLNLDFIKNLTKQQKGIILAALVGIILVVAIIVICIVVGTAGNNNNGGENNDGFETGGENGGENNGVVSGDIIDFALASAPSKQIYYVGEVYDYTGLSVYIQSTIGGGRFVDYINSPQDFTITGFDTSKAVDEQTITVEYAGQTATFTIQVLEIQEITATLKSIRLDPDNMPAATCKKDYAPDISGAKLICEYNDGSTKVILLDYKYLYNYATELKAANVGDVVEIPVRYSENGITKKTSFDVTIVE